MSITASSGSLFELDRELDLLLDEIQEQAEEGGGDNVSSELVSLLPAVLSRVRQ